MFNKVLAFLNLLDSEGRLSITNLAVLITLIKLATSTSASITEAGTLLIVLGNYALKRHTIANATAADSDASTIIQASVDDTKKQIEDIKSTLTSLALRGK